MDITLPSLLIGFLIATLVGAIYHLIRGGNLGRLLLYILLGWVGFWIGHFLGAYIGWTFGSIGALHVGMGVLISLVVLVVGGMLFDFSKIR